MVAATSRRALLRAAAGAGAATLAGCGGSSALQRRVKKVGKVPAGDVEVLNRLLDIEHRAIAAYTAGIPLLPSSFLLDGRRFLNQEISHAGELSGLVRKAGAKPNKRHPSYDLGHPTGAHEIFELLHDVERAQVAGYLEAIPALTPGPVRAAVATILANDAQHISILRARLGQPPVPSALVSADE